MESFDSYTAGEEDLHGAAGARPFDGDGYMGYDPRLPSQRFDSFQMPEEGYGGENPYMSSQSVDLGEVEDGEDGFSSAKLGSSNGGFNAPPVYQNAFDDDLGDGQHSPAMSSPFGQSFESRLHSEFTAGNEFSPSADSNGKDFGHLDEGFGHGEVDSVYGYPPPSGSLNGAAVLPPPEEMQSEEGFILREWKRQNAIRLEEKARLEREQLSQIIDAADAFKDEFYTKRKTHCETNKNNNRDKEKVFLDNLVNFHATADKHYWKAVGELVPHELPSFESKSRGKDKDKKKPSVVVNHGPKPGKATDLTRMRQVLVKLKHNPPAHMKAPPPAPPAAAPAGAPAGAEGSEAKPAEPPTAATAGAGGPEPLQQGSIPVVAAA